MSLFRIRCHNAGRTARPAALAASLCLSAIFLPSLGLAVDDPVSPPPPAEVREVRAQLTPRYSTTLSSELAGSITSLPVREGQSFSAGDTLVTMDCTSHDARLAQADAQLRRNERKARALRLLDQRGATSKLEHDLAQIDVAAAQAERDLVAADVARCTIAAPFAGSIAALAVKNYQYVPAGEPIVTILSDQELEAEMLVPSRWLPWLAKDARVSLHVDELGRDFPLVVDRIAANIDPVSQSVKVFARVDGNFPALLPGMSGLARFFFPEARGSR